MDEQKMQERLDSLAKELNGPHAKEFDKVIYNYAKPWFA